MTQTIINVPAAFDPTDITITDNTSGAWLIKDDSGSPTEYMRIDTTSGAELTKFVVPDDGTSFNKFVVATERSNSELISVTPRRVGLSNIEGVFFSGASSTQVWVSGPGVFRIQDGAFTQSMTGTQTSSTYLGGTSSWNIKGVGGNFAKIEHDSNATFTLDDGSGAVFKVVDDNSSPRTYLTITEAGATEFGNAVGANTINGSSITIISGNITFRNAASSQLAEYSQNYFIQNGGGNFKGQSVYGASTTTTATGSTTIANKTLKQGTTFFYNSSGSGTATITVQYKTDGSFYEDGTSLTERFVMLHNKDASQSVTYKFEPVVGEGSDAPALGATDTVADDLLDGTGVTLAAGKTAIFKVVTYAISTTHSDHKHFWTTIAKD